METLMFIKFRPLFEDIKTKWENPVYIQANDWLSPQKHGSAWLWQTDVLFVFINGMLDQICDVQQTSKDADWLLQ